MILGKSNKSNPNLFGQIQTQIFLDKSFLANPKANPFTQIQIFLGLGKSYLGQILQGLGQIFLLTQIQIFFGQIF